MTAKPSLAPLLKSLASHAGVDAALDELARGALAITGSRHAMIARLDEERGVLELRHGAGAEWTRKGANIQIDLDLREGIVAYVAATGTTIVSGNVTEDPRYRNLFGTTQSEIAVPIRDSFGRIRAVLNVESDIAEAYSSETVETVEALAFLASLYVERADATSREEALLAVGSALDQAQTEGDLLDQVIEVGREVLRFQACSIFLLDRATSRYVLRATIGQLREQVGQISYLKEEGCTGWVCSQGKPILLEQPQKDPRWRGRYLEFPGDQIAAFLAVPILLRGSSIGAIRVIRRVSENAYLDRRFTESDLRVLQAIAEQLAIGLDNIRAVARLVHSERMIAWGELSAKSSHMIGNRVFALKGDVNELGHLLGESDLPVADLKAIQGSLSTNVIRIEEILQDFRDFVAATQIHPEPGDLAQLLRETAAEVFPKRSSVRLQLQLDQTPRIAFDAKRLRRAISELLENALSYVSDGEIVLSCGFATPEQLRRAGVAAAGHWAFIEVADSGPGIEDSQKEVIFQPFHTGRVKGMGLGLSIVKGIIDAHGGHVIEVGSQGTGARFLILLPGLDRLKTEEA